MFLDRRDAGAKLASKLLKYKDNKDVLVLALPRGGVMTGYETARALRVPMDVLIVRKIGVPWQPELAAGALSETGALVINKLVVSGYKISKEFLEKEVSRQKEEISRRIELYRNGKGIAGLEDKIIILIDDGAATGATMKAAVETLGEAKIMKLVVAIPVSPADTAEELRGMSDEFVCIETHDDFLAVGNYYQDFTQVSDEEVVDLLERSKKEKG
jgi:putative phosphoribosyl transferase